MFFVGVHGGGYERGYSDSFFWGDSLLYKGLVVEEAGKEIIAPVEDDSGVVAMVVYKMVLRASFWAFPGDLSVFF